MVNYLGLIHRPQINHEFFFEILRDFRKGGLKPEIWDDFLQSVKKFEKHDGGYELFDQFSLSEISQEDFKAVQVEFIKRSIERSKKCWHPEASVTTCNIDANGRIIVSAAHSVQSNGVLSKIAENGHVMTIDFKEGRITGAKIGKRLSSIFWGFCSKHDAIFRPIEVEPYSGSEMQHFLFAYRAFVVSAHKKIESSFLIKLDKQAEVDIDKIKDIFDHAILSNNYGIIETYTYMLPLFYPIAVSSSFYLDYDFDGNSIQHSASRMEYIFLTILPLYPNKSVVLVSFLAQDKQLYENLARQIRDRNNLKSDISILVLGHCENNVYFDPRYYEAFIQRIESDFLDIIKATQLDVALLDSNNKVQMTGSMTPKNYLNNPWNVSIFGY